MTEAPTGAGAIPVPPSPVHGERHPDRKVVGRDLSQARKKAGLSREIVRKLLGHFDKQMVYRWESGKRTPSLESIVQLGVAYQCSLQDLCPSLWSHYSSNIDKRRAELEAQSQNQPYRREVAHRTRKWEK